MGFEEDLCFFLFRGEDDLHISYRGSVVSRWFFFVICVADSCTPDNNHESIVTWVWFSRQLKNLTVLEG